MNTGKTLFDSAHGLPAMDGTFTGGSSTGMAAITGSGRFPAPSNTASMAFAQLPTGKAARIETCLSVHASKTRAWRCSVPALDAGRCQRKARLAYPCGCWPAAHHPGEDAVRRRRTGVGPDQYRLRPGLDDHRSVPVGLSVGALPHHQGGGEDAHAARPAGQHSEFYPHLGWQAARRSCPRYALAGSRSHLRRGSWLRRLCPPFVLHQAGAFFVTRAKSNIDAHRVNSSADGSLDRHHLADRPSPWTASTPVRITPNFCGASASVGPTRPARRWSSSPTTSRFRPPPSARSTTAAGRWNSSSSPSSIFGSSSSTARRRTR